MATKLNYARRAVAHLKKSDPVMRRLIERVGPCKLSVRPDDTFTALSSAIVFQQLNGKAASTILARVHALFGGEDNMNPEKFLAMDGAKLRAAGLSANKLASMRDLAAKCQKEPFRRSPTWKLCATRKSSSA